MIIELKFWLGSVGRRDDKDKCEAEADEWDWYAVSSWAVAVGEAEIAGFELGTATRDGEAQVAAAAASK